MEKVLRVGVLGMGNMGKAHARSMMRMENVEIEDCVLLRQMMQRPLPVKIIWTAGFMMTVSA